MVLEDPEGYLFWMTYVDLDKGLVYVQDDSLHVAHPCTRVFRVFRICDELKAEFKLREAKPDEAGRFIGTFHSDTIPSPLNFDSLKPTEGFQTILSTQLA